MGKSMCHRLFSVLQLRQTLVYSLSVVVLCGAWGAACYAADPAPEGTMVQVKVERVGFDPVSQSPVILLLDKDRTRAMPIWIGNAEARAIDLELRGQPAPRPLTHDLLKNILVQVGVDFDKVVVTELKDSTYYARIHLTTSGTPLEIDSRPSDAIALALRFHRPIFVAKGLLEDALPVDPHQPQTAALDDLQNVQSRGVTVQNVSRDLARAFQLPDTNGVLVADVETGAAAQGHLQRGDIIVAIAGKTIHNVADFQTQMRQMAEGHRQTVSMQIHRNGKSMGISLPVAAATP